MAKRRRVDAALHQTLWDQLKADELEYIGNYLVEGIVLSRYGIGNQTIRKKVGAYLQLLAKIKKADALV
jgi:hypothetical protein